MIKTSITQKLITLCFALLIPDFCKATERYLTLYHGKYSDDKLGHVLLSKPVEYIDSYLSVAALSQVYRLKNPIHQWEAELQLGKHHRGQDHWEVNALAIYRLNPPPLWNLLKTSIAIGDGLSYALETPPLEKASTTNEGATRLLNYIVVEMTAAPIQAKNWSLVVRVHHRSGVYGIFDDVKGGSNVLAAGVKFRLP